MSRWRFMLVLLLGACAASARAATVSAPWSASLSATAVRKSLAALPKKVAVVRIGPANDALNAASAALAAAFRANGAQLLDEAALGDTARLGDVDLARQAATLGADATALVRVVIPQGAPLQAQVSILDAQGHQLGELLAAGPDPDPPAQSANDDAQAAQPPGPQPNVAVPPPGAVPPPPQPAAPAPSPLAPPLTDEVPPGPPGARALYAEQLLGFGAYARWTYWGPQWFEGPYVGTLHQPLAMPDFFERVGRKDLAQAYRHRENTRDALIVGGSLVVVGSLIAAIAIADSSPTFDSCGFPASDACLGSVNDSRTSASTGAALVGIGGSAVGLVLAGLGWEMNPMPITGPEAHQLASAYDQQLQAKLGLGAHARTSADPTRIRISLRPSLGPGRGGMNLRLDF